MPELISQIARRLYLAGLPWRVRPEGINAANSRLLVEAGSVVDILRSFGAEVGAGAVMDGPIVVVSAPVDYGNLRVGERVHIGMLVLLALTCPVLIEDHAVISMGSTLLTHQPVGQRPQADCVRDRRASLHIGARTYVGAHAVILCGANLRAGAVVTRPVPPNSLAQGIPARMARRHIPVPGDPPEA